MVVVSSTSADVDTEVEISVLSVVVTVEATVLVAGSDKRCLRVCTGPDTSWPKMCAAGTSTYVTGVVVAMIDVTTGMDRRLEQ